MLQPLGISAGAAVCYIVNVLTDVVQHNAGLRASQNSAVLCRLMLTTTSIDCALLLLALPLLLLLLLVLCANVPPWLVLWPHSSMTADVVVNEPSTSHQMLPCPASMKTTIVSRRKALASSDN
jgi:hypothetical protein